MCAASRPRVVVVGASFAGLAAVRRLPRGYRVTVLDPSPWFEFLPNIHELVSGVKTPALLRLARHDVIGRAGHRFVRDAATAIDTGARVVHTAAGRSLAYDALIVATGGVNATHGVPGVAQHALPFDTVDDCQRIGRRVRQLAHRRAPAEVAIVGGGFEGVEALGEVLRRYRDAPHLHVRVIEGGARLLSGLPAALDVEIRRLTAAYAVTFETEARVAVVDARGLVLDSGARRDADAVIWTGGPAPPSLLAEAGLASAPGQWAAVDETLQSRTAPEVFVAGDAAALPVALAKQAYHALDMGAHAAVNVERWFDGERLAPFRPAPKPLLIAFGDLSCFLVWGGLVVAGAALAAGKEAVFELTMADLDGRAWPWVVGAAGARVAQATAHQLWPVVTSPRALLRHACVRVLAGVPGLGTG
jgi:NADH dehydrogenase